MNHIAVSPSMNIELRIVEEERSLRILLAEDNPELRRLLAFILRREGHEVVAVADGAELLEALAATLVEVGRPCFDLVICEHGIHGIPGLSVLAGLRARDRATAFILITGDTDVQTQARRLGAVTLAGPLTVGAIRGAIHQTADVVRALPGLRALL
jgi:CheY-like chemotaxis protein